jgi:hypothetical protein
MRARGKNARNFKSTTLVFLPLRFGPGMFDYKVLRLLGHRLQMAGHVDALPVTPPFA